MPLARGLVNSLENNLNGQIFKDKIGLPVKSTWTQNHRNHLHYEAWVVVLRASLFTTNIVHDEQFGHNVQFCSSTYLMPGTMNVEHGLTQLWGSTSYCAHLANHRSGIDMDIIIIY
jgi:hypothetical protein